MGKIWERYFVKETLKIFVMCIACFYGLYVLIDYSTHAKSFYNHRWDFKEISLFYLYEFFIQIDILVPFALLIASIKTLSSLNIRNELVALLTSGLSLKRILRPFILLGFLLTATLYFNIEVLQPKALRHHAQLDKARLKDKQKKYDTSPIQQITLQDHSSLIFQHYDFAKEAFVDVFWVRSSDDIYRLESLTAYTDVPQGKSVEHFQRDLKGNLILTEYFSEKNFPQLSFDEKTVKETVTLPKELSLLALSKKLPDKKELLTEKELAVLTSFHYKLALPWMCLLTVIACAPFCTHFSRSFSVYKIYAVGIFALLAFYLVLDAAVILAERQVLTAALAVWIPFGLVFSFFSLRFARL